MLRVLNYPYAEQDVKVLDRYGNLRGTLHLQQGENTLPITPYGCHLKEAESLSLLHLQAMSLQSEIAMIDKTIARIRAYKNKPTTTDIYHNIHKVI